MPATRLHPRFVALRDGRRVVIASSGPVDGALVLYLHGAIGSPQRRSSDLDAITDELAIRYVMVSRPGFGGSDPLPGRTLLDFGADAAAVADHLGRDRFAVVGVSAGGPYALACAHELPDRVMATAVVSGMPWGAPPDRIGGLSIAARAALLALRRRPRCCSRAGDALVGCARRHPRLVAHAMTAATPRADRAAMRDHHAREDTVARFLEAAAGGIGPMVEDYGLCAGGWGFQPRDVRGLVQLWHGARDTLVPVDRALLLASALPRAQISVDADEGHFFYRRRLREILGELSAAMCRPPQREPSIAASPASRVP